MPVPNTSFGTATSAIPLSELDANFATPITLGNTAIQLGNTVTTLNNMTLANVTISSGNVTITNVSVTTANVSGTANVSTLVVVGNATVGGNTTVGGNVTLSGGTANGVAYLNTSKALTTGSALTFDGSALAVTGTLTATQSTADTSAIAVVASAATRTKVFGATGSTTAGMYGLLSNTGGSMLFGVENSGGGNIVTGSAAYSAYFGTNTNTPVSIAVNSAQVAVFDASGNLGLGVTPVASVYTPSRNLFVGQGTVLTGRTTINFTSLNNNCYELPTSSVAAFINSSFAASQYIQYQGAHLWTRSTATPSANADIVSVTAMTLDASGNLLVGTTGLGTIGSSSGSTITASGAIYSASTGDSVFSRRSSDGIVITFRRDTTSVGDISVTTTTTAYNSYSDYRLKENIAPMTGALAKVAQLKPVTYKWKLDGSDGQGFIAHELQAVISDAVTGEKDAIEADGNPKYQGVDTSFLVATLTAAIQEQQALITQLTARITALEGA